MNRDALIRDLESRGWTAASHPGTTGPETWLGLPGPAGASIRVILYPDDDGRAEIYAFAPGPGRLLAWQARLPGGTPSPVIAPARGTEVPARPSPA